MIATPETRTAAVLEEMERFVEAHGTPETTPWHSIATSERVNQLLCEQTRRLFTRPQTETLCWRNDFELTGLASWTRLEWDSEQFGFPAARLDLLAARGDHRDAATIKTNLVNEVVRDCRNSGIHHLICRVDAAGMASIDALQRNGFELIDGIQTFSLRIPRAATFEKASNAFTLRMFREADLPQVLQLARTAYVHDRFHADSALDTETADRVNEVWVRNSCLGHIADAVIVAAAGDTVLGYVTCRVDKEATRVLGMGCGEIGMVATTTSARNSGVASAATIHALEWFAMQGVEFVEVGTQLRNIAAARLYERCGFRLAAASLTWRKII